MGRPKLVCEYAVGQGFFILLKWRVNGSMMVINSYDNYEKKKRAVLLSQHTLLYVSFMG